MRSLICDESPCKPIHLHINLSLNNKGSVRIPYSVKLKMTSSLMLMLWHMIEWVEKNDDITNANDSAEALLASNPGLPRSNFVS